MVQLVLIANFKCQLLKWGDATVHIKEISSLLWNSDLTNLKMCEVVMQTAETVST